MTDDPTRPTPPEPETDPDQGADRSNVVYLVPAVSGPVDVEQPATSGDRSGGTPMLPAGDSEGRAWSGQGGASVPPDEVGDQQFGDDQAQEQAERQEWAWVQEWRAGQEPTPWATGVALAVFTALIVGVAVWVLSAGLADRPVVAVLVNLLVAAGLAPAIWLSRGLPVLRWIAAGAAAGIVIGWCSALLMLSLPVG